MPPSHEDDHPFVYLAICLAIVTAFILYGYALQDEERNNAQTMADKIGGYVDKEMRGNSGFYHYFVRTRFGRRVDL